MRIGIGKELKPGEKRVGLMPEQAATLVQDGHAVYVEVGAGIGSGFADTDYQAAGAQAVPKQEMYERCDLIVKVKAPLDEEVPLLGPHHTLFTYLHFDGNASPEYGRQLCATGGVGIAYEWGQKSTGELPLLSPMSDITGVLFARRSMELLMGHAGMLGGDYVEGCPPARALVIGLGHSVNMPAKSS
jgi:alanine dehydrogenase